MTDIDGAANEEPDSGTDVTRLLRRWGPIGVIAIVAIVVIVVLATSGDDDDDTAGDDVDVAGDTAGDDTASDDTASDDTAGDDTAGDDTAGDDAGADDTVDDDTTGDGPDPFADGVVSWTEAEAAGITDQVEWGDRCDTDLGTLAYPSFFAGECYAPFEGDNGGETSPGVTADTIEIVWYTQPEVDPVYDYITSAIRNDDTGDDVVSTIQGLVDFYGSYFETYGRTVELIRYNATGTTDDEVAARADAEAIARDIRPFMVWNSPTLVTEAFAETLAANEVMCMCVGGQSEFAQERAPYLHTITKSDEQSRVLLAEYVGKRLAGRNAVHSGDFQDQERVFGYLYLETGDESTLAAEGFRDRLRESYGVELADIVPYSLDPATLQEQAATRIARLKEAGVTSVIFAGDAIAPRDFTIEATAQEYFPEWILAGTALVDTTAFARTYDQQQWQHAFGMSNLSARGDRSVEGFYFLYEWFNGEPPAAVDTIGILFQPSVFFAYAQATGPDLTPENYADAMLNAAPTARGALTQPSISFGSQGLWPDGQEPDYFGIDDVSEIWWDPDATGLDEIDREGVGMYQWVAGGQRYLPGEWPETEPDVFDPEGAVAFYTELPASEVGPPYPSPAG